jgi:hypothetical protein
LSVDQLFGFGPTYAIFDSDSVSEDDFRLVRAGRLPLYILTIPDGGSSLDFLEPIFDVIEELRVQTYDCRDPRAIERMPRLRSLGLHLDAQFSTDLSGLEHLTLFAGPFKKFESVARCHHLTELRISSPTPAAFRDFDSPLERLEIYSGSRLAGVPRLARPELLNRLTVYSVGAFDLSNLALCENLSELEFDRCKELTNTAVLLELPALTKLEFENCPQMDDWIALANLHVPNIVVARKNPFDLEFRETVGSSGRWTFPPGNRNIAPPRGKAVSTFEYLWHPAVGRPLMIPSETLGELSMDDLPRRWLDMPHEEQLVQLENSWRAAVVYARSIGADTLHGDTPPYGDGDTYSSPIEDVLAAITARPRDLHNVELRRGGTIVAAIADSIEDGILIRTEAALEQLTESLKR